MTIEEEFFKTFGIEKRKHAFLFREPDGSDEYYPEITAEKLLELICIFNELTGRLIELNSSNINDLKEEILQVCISNFMAFRLPYKKKFIEQVRKLFEGEKC